MADENIPPFDPTKDHAQIMGPATVTRGARYQQNGYTYDAAGRALALDLFPAPAPITMAPALQPGQPPQKTLISPAPEGLENWTQEALWAAVKARGGGDLPPSTDLVGWLVDHWGDPQRHPDDNKPVDKTPATEAMERRAGMPTKEQTTPNVARGTDFTNVPAQPVDKTPETEAAERRAGMATKEQTTSNFARGTGPSVPKLPEVEEDDDDDVPPKAPFRGTAGRRPR